MQLNINGMGGRSNSFLIDGANMKGYAGIATVTAADSTLGVDTIREFRVVTNAFSADYGRAMGGVISIATKSGTNAFHGSAFEFFRDSKFDAPNYFDPADASGNKQAPPFKRNQFGGSFGGPIKKNRVFFFGGYERLQEDLGHDADHDRADAAARAGTVNPAVKPYLDLYPLPNGADLGGGIARYIYAFNRPTRENFGQGTRRRAVVEQSRAVRPPHDRQGAPAAAAGTGRCRSSRPIRRRTTSSSPPKKSGS